MLNGISHETPIPPEDSRWAERQFRQVGAMPDFLSSLPSAFTDGAIKLGFGAVGGFSALLSDRIIRFWGRPRIRLESGHGEPFVRLVTEKGKPSIWLRVRGYNEGRTEALSARAYLIDLTKVEDDGRASVIFKGDAIVLFSSAGGDSGTLEPVQIAQKFGRFFDVGCVVGGFLRIPNTSYWSTTPCLPGNYVLKVAVSGDNFRPSIATIRIAFTDDDGVAPALSLERVEDENWLSWFFGIIRF